MYTLSQAIYALAVLTIIYCSSIIILPLNIEQRKRTTIIFTTKSKERLYEKNYAIIYLISIIGDDLVDYSLVYYKEGEK